MMLITEQANMHEISGTEEVNTFLEVTYPDYSAGYECQYYRWDGREHVPIE